MVICIGEILLDITKKEGESNLEMVGVPGGDCFIVSANIARNGGDTSFYGVTGNDYFGKTLIDKAKAYPFKGTHIFSNEEANTTLAINYEDEGNIHTEYIRNHGADYQFDKDLKLSIHQGDIVHFGSFLLTNKKGRVVVNSFLKQIKKNKCFSSFDVNLKLDLYKNKVEARNIYLSVLKEFDIVKMNDEEYNFLARNQKVANFIKTYLKPGVLLFITKGIEGSVCYYKDRSYEATCLPLNVVDPRGAGDAFYARCLLELDNRPHKSSFGDVKFSNILMAANIDGAEATQFIGTLK